MCIYTSYYKHMYLLCLEMTPKHQQHIKHQILVANTLLQ